MKQTAVEWLEDNLIGNPFSEKDFAHNVNVFKQAKEMEKEQIEEAYKDGSRDLEIQYSDVGEINSEQYYNETYNDNQRTECIECQHPQPEAKGSQELVDQERGRPQHLR